LLSDAPFLFGALSSTKSRRQGLAGGAELILSRTDSNNHSSPMFTAPYFNLFLWLGGIIERNININN